jgi:hypothetical protein
MAHPLYRKSSDMILSGEMGSQSAALHEKRNWTVSGMELLHED